MDREKPGEYQKLHDETFYKKPNLEQLGVPRQTIGDVINAEKVRSADFGKEFKPQTCHSVASFGASEKKACVMCAGSV